MLHNKSIHKQVSISNKTLMNTFSNFTLNNLLITYDDNLLHLMMETPPLLLAWLIL